MGSKYYISVSDLSEYLEGLIKKDPFLNEVDIVRTRPPGRPRAPRRGAGRRRHGRFPHPAAGRRRRAERLDRAASRPPRLKGGLGRGLAALITNQPDSRLGDNAADIVIVGRRLDEARELVSREEHPIEDRKSVV